MKPARPFSAAPLLCALGFGLLRAPLHAQVSSTFDTGYNGWNPAFFGWSWQADGGNPGGYVQFTETGIPPYVFMVAPGTFHGNWSALDGVGALRYDFRLFAGTPDDTAGIQVTGGFGTGGSMFWRQPATAGTLGWETVVAPLTEGSWQITAGTWAGILADVTDVQLFPDYYDHFGETTGVDNFELVPEPSGAAMVAATLAVLGCARLWHRRREAR